MEDIGTLAGNNTSAVAVSSDGNVIVGSSLNSAGIFHAFRWTSAGMEDLGTLGYDCFVRAISRDGSINIEGYIVTLEEGGNAKQQIVSATNHTFLNVRPDTLYRVTVQPQMTGKILGLIEETTVKTGIPTNWNN